MIKQLYKKQHRGFTLIEALVSISILTIIFASPLALAFRMYSRFDYLHKKMVANSLAQEGIELVEIFRANAVIQCIRAGDCDTTNMSVSWTDTNNGFVNRMLAQCATECAVDFSNISNIVRADGTINYDLFVASTNCNNMFTHDNGMYTCASYPTITGEARSGYARYIKVERYNDPTMSANTELLVTSGVTFISNGEQYRSEIKTILKSIN